MTDQERDKPEDEKQVRRQKLEERRRRSSADYNGDHLDKSPRTAPYKREQHRDYSDPYEEDF